MTEAAITSRAREVREIELGEGSAPHGVIGQLLAHVDRYLGEWLRAPGSGGAPPDASAGRSGGAGE